MLTHINEQNLPKMVNVADKSITHRIAVASGVIEMSEEAYRSVKEHRAKKGAVLETAVVAAVLAAKQTSSLIPMCHPLSITSVDVDVEDLKNGFKLTSKVSTDGKTGVEMEALTSVSIGLLTIYDMLKAIDKSMQISQIVLENKSGGNSGEYKRTDS